jgi:hypothetical protein
LLLEKFNTRNKKSSEKWKSSIDFDGVATSKIAQFQDATKEALKQFVDTMERGNSEFKQKIK